MAKFRKIPIIVEALQVEFPVDSSEDLPEWFHRGISEGKVKFHNTGYNIQTLEGVMFAPNGNWIVQGITGELYSVEPNIFKQTFEPVEE